MSNHVIYQKRGDSVVPVITIDDAPSVDSSAAGHLVDSNGIATALSDLEAKIPEVDGFVTLDTTQVIEGAKSFTTAPVVSDRNYMGGTATVSASGADTVTATVSSSYAVTVVNVESSSTAPVISIDLSWDDFDNTDGSDAAVLTVVLAPVSAVHPSIAWGSNIRWAEGEPPVIEDFSCYHVVTFLTYDKGLHWFGTPSALNVPA